MNSSSWPRFEGYVPGNGHRLWNQSFYFNAYDPVSRAGCFVRLGFMEGLEQSNLWFIVFQDGRPLFQRICAQLPHTLARIANGVTLAGVNARVIEPLQTARITFSEADFEFDLQWQALHPMMDSIALSADGGTAFENSIAHAHLEGACAVSGHIRHRDGRIDFNGKGARDIAAGPRDWSALSHYRLIMPIFDDGFTPIAIHGLADGGRESYMKIVHDGERWQKLAEVEDHLLFEDDDMTVRHADWRLQAEDGRRWQITGKRLFRCFLPVDGFMLAEHLMEFTRDDGAVGYGLAECGYRFPWSGNGSK